MSSRKIQDLYLAILSDLCFVNPFDNITLSQCLLDNTSRGCFLFVRILRNKVRVSAFELRWSRNRTRRVLWSTNLQILALYLHLLKNKGFGSFFSGPYVHKSIMTVTCNPTAEDRIAVLKDLKQISKKVQREDLHQRFFQVLLKWH